MPKKNNFLAYFLVLFILSLLIFGASKMGFLNPLDSFFKGMLSPFQAVTYSIFAKITDFGSNSQIQSLKAQNVELTNKLIDQTKLIEDNKALKDQFQTENPRSQNLLSADVIGSPGFIPGISVPEEVVLNKGTIDGVKLGQAVVYQNNLLGKITSVTASLASVALVTNASFSLTVQTLSTGAQGVAKGQGSGVMILDNVLLSDNLKKGDLVLTKGDTNMQSVGFPPDLVVGQIVSVNKNPSDLFQTAALQSLINVAKLSKVFIVVNY
jgi:rod shape-determining protein MreC